MNEQKEPIVHRDKVLDWLDTQGFALEHQTASALRREGFVPSLGQVYTDPETHKLRDIDVSGVLSPGSRPEALRRVAVFECKTGKMSAWIVRRAAKQVRFAKPVYIASPRADEFLSRERRIVQAALGVPEPFGFAVLSAGKPEPTGEKSERVPAFAALQQAVSAAQGALGHYQQGGSCLTFPVVVTTAPLFTLDYTDDVPDLVSAEWSRVLFSGGHRVGGPTLVDVVHHEHLTAYLRNVLRPAFEDLSEFMMESAWLVDAETQPAPGVA